MNLDINDYGAGHFLAAWVSTSVGSSTPSWLTIGSTEEGFTVDTNLHEDEIKDDRFGQAVADTVQAGADYHVSGVLLNIGAVQTAMVLNSQETPGSVNGNVGLLGSQIYGSLVLTPVAGTTAALKLGAGNSIVFYLCAVMNSFSYLLGNAHRKIPVTFRALPDPAHPGLAWAIVTTSTLGTVPSTYP